MVEQRWKFLRDGERYNGDQKRDGFETIAADNVNQNVIM